VLENVLAGLPEKKTLWSEAAVCLWEKDYQQIQNYF
jgi:hypothetical protein